jgi:hypothetical protein
LSNNWPKFTFIFVLMNDKFSAAAPEYKILYKWFAAEINL